MTEECNGVYEMLSKSAWLDVESRMQMRTTSKTSKFFFDVPAEVGLIRINGTHLDLQWRASDVVAPQVSKMFARTLEM